MVDRHPRRLQPSSRRLRTEPARAVEHPDGPGAAPGDLAQRRPALAVCGIPETLYTDHGSDFTSQHLEQVAADLKMALVFSIAGKPRGRGKIERFFETVNQLFLCQQPGYTPAGLAVQPSRR